METSENNNVRASGGKQNVDGPQRSSVTTADGVTLPLYRWPAIGPLRATVALLHDVLKLPPQYIALAYSPSHPRTAASHVFARLVADCLGVEVESDAN